MTFHKHISGASWGELVSWLKCLDPPQDSHHHISPQLWRRSLILQPQEMFITVSKVYNFLIIALQAYSAFTHCNLLMCFPISILQFSIVFFMCCLCYVLMHCERLVLRVDAFWLHLPMCNSHTAMMQRSQAAFCASCAKSPSLEHNTCNIPTSNSHLNLESSSKTRTKARERKSIDQYFFNIVILHLSWSWGTPEACPVTDPLTHSASVTGTVAVHIALPKCWKPSIADHIAKYCQVSLSINKYRQVLHCKRIASGAWWCHADLQIAWRGFGEEPPCIFCLSTVHQGGFHRAGYTWYGRVWHRGSLGEVCAEEEVKLVHLLPLQGDHCRGFPPAVNFCFRNFFSNQEAGGVGAQLSLWGEKDG